MALPNDVARCAGVGSESEGWREGCEDCQRRTSLSDGDRIVNMMPPPIIAFWCESRIEPNAR
jgi:hypothetical protein